MTPFEVEVDVPESRQVTLPPETPTGKVRLVLVTSDHSPGVQYIRPTDPAEATEFDGFLNLLPVLRPTHGGHYVAVRGGEVIASGLFLDAVLKLARATTGGAFYCGWVEPVGGYVSRSGKIVVE